jgi:hypothetical protein
MKTLTYLGAAVVAAFLAIFLRFAEDNVAREWVTVALGYEWRAVVEHMLAGFAIPLGITLAIGSGGYWGDRALYSLLRPKWYSGNKAWDDYLSGIVVLLCTAFIAVIYISLEYRFELLQATVSVYGGLPRNYFQWGQFLFGDVFGALLAVAAVYRLASFDSWQDLLKYLPGKRRKARIHG